MADNKNGFDPMALLGQAVNYLGNTDFGGYGSFNTSPVAALLGGHPDQVIPRIQQTFSDPKFMNAYVQSFMSHGNGTVGGKDAFLSKLKSDTGQAAGPPNPKFRTGGDTMAQGGTGPKINVNKVSTGKGAADYGYTPTGTGTEPMRPVDGPPAPIATSQNLPAIAPPKAPNVLTKLANKVKSDINQATPADIASNPRAMQEAGPMQATLAKYNVYNASQAGPAMDRIYSQYINPEMSRNPKMIPLDSSNASGTGLPALVPTVVKEMQKLEPGLNEREANLAASKYLNNLYDVARNDQTTPTNSPTVPGFIDSPSVLQMRTSLNNTRAVQQYFKDGSINNTSDLAAVASRNALSKVLDAAHPEISQAIKDYGTIKEAYPSLFKASMQHTPAYNLPAIGLNMAKSATSGTLRAAGKMADTPGGKLALQGGAITAGLGGAYLVGKGNPNQGQNTQGNNQGNGIKTNNQSSGDLNSTNHTQIIPQTIDDIKPDSKGNYNVVDPYQLKDQTGSPKFIGDKEYSNQIAQNNALIAQKTTQLADPSIRFNPIKSAQVQSEITNLQTENSSLDQKHQSSSAVNSAYNAAKNLNNQFDAADQTLKDTSPSIFTGISLPYIGAEAAKYREATDPKYSALVQKLQQLESNAGLPSGSLYKPGQTKEVLQANLEAARKNTLNTFYTGLNTSLAGNQTSAPSAPPVANNALPPVNTPTNSAVYAPMANNLPLPPIVSSLKLNPLNQPIQ